MSNLKLKNINFTVNTNESVDGFVTKRTKSDLVTSGHKYDIDTKQLSINNNEDISFINAVDIYWNNSEIPGENLVISNTGDLISRLADTYTKAAIRESFIDLSTTVDNNSRTTQEAITSLTDTVQSLPTFNDLDNKQNNLVSGENIKTINNESILGEGNINIDTVLSENYVPSTETGNNLSLSIGDTYEEAFSKLEKTINELKDRITILENNN